MECFRLLLKYLAWIEHQFLSDIRDSRKAVESVKDDERCGRVRKSMHHSWLAKGLGLLCWGFKGILGRDSVGRGQYSYNRISGISSRTMHQSINPSLSQSIWPRWASRQYLTVLIVQTLFPCDFWLFPKLKENLRGCRYETIEEMKEAVTKVIDMLTQEDFHGALQKLLERYNKCIAAGGDYFDGD